MAKYAKMEPEYLADMMESERRLYVPKHEVPYRGAEAPETPFEFPADQLSYAAFMKLRGTA